MSKLTKIENGWFVHVKRLFHPHLLPLKLVFFFQLGAASCLIPYIPIFIQSLGLNAAENGLIFGVLPFIALLSKPAIGVLSDKFGKSVRLLQIFSLLQTVFMFSIYFVPPIQINYNETILCQNESANMQQNFTNFICANGSSIIAPRVSDPPPILPENVMCACIWQESGENIADSTLLRWTKQFWITGILLIIGWFGYGASITLEDSIAFSTIMRFPLRSTYGENRVFGTMGWAIFALIVGFLLDSFSDTITERNFLSAFVTFAVTAVIGLLCTFFLPVSQPAKSHKLMASVITRLITVDVILFSAGTLVAGFNSGLLYGYLGWYQAEIGASNLLLGITVFVQCCYEAPMMAFSGWIIKKIGYHPLMLMCLLSFGVRFVGYSVMADPWFVLIIDCVHSVGYGLFYGALTSFAFSKSPLGGGATLQGVLGAVYEGIGQGIGGIAAGFLYQKYGGKRTWLGYGVFSFVASGLYAIAGLLMWSFSKDETVRKEGQPEQENEVEDYEKTRF